jgi:hypothetical protein
MVGDYGFDPMELSDNQNSLVYARAAEIKNGRVAQVFAIDRCS